MQNLSIYFNSEEAKLIWFNSDFINAILWRKKKNKKKTKPQKNQIESEFAQMLYFATFN